MPTLSGVGGEVWLEAESEDERPRTLREDQPELAEAYRREAARILAQSRDSFSDSVDLDDGDGFCVGRDIGALDSISDFED